MLPSEFRHMLDVALRDLESTISLTLTSVTDDSDQLQKLLTTALAAGRRHGARLTWIELPMRHFALFGTRFRDVPLGHSGDSEVMRFQFKPSAHDYSFEAAA